MSAHLDLSNGARPGRDVQRVDVPVDLLGEIDHEARRLGVMTRAFCSRGRWSFAAKPFMTERVIHWPAGDVLVGAALLGDGSSAAANASAMAAQLLAAIDTHWSLPWGNPLSK